ncbi:Cyclophilin type peptidyl-prolyl cis-trans isomerase [Handroanthus impetiginosus]|uniref:Cyclophilin type peptidyl-prolyl cis-trans isomerase n=1 Tax=Handroanthus impetiginosus TaxID=429701 RepID=A0A2G9GCU4_9LAMI|nr:Cyclophilin type peptidyl-prolyl cis-trans isomerase [Handroanthus impetiginosus]
MSFSRKSLHYISGKSLQYKGSTFHQMIPNFMSHGGDFTTGNGAGGESIGGSGLADENFEKNCTANVEWLDGNHVVFGQVVDCYDVLKAIENVGSRGGRTSTPVARADCGKLS